MPQFWVKTSIAYLSYTLDDLLIGGEGGGAITVIIERIVIHQIYGQIFSHLILF